jgi:hypothetical protein
MAAGSIDKASYFGIDISSILYLCVILPKAILVSLYVQIMYSITIGNVDAICSGC